MEQKPGWKTTEFWGKNAAQLIALGTAVWSIYSGHSVTPDQQAAALKTAIQVIGFVDSVYAVSRGLTKKSEGGLK